MAEKSVMTHTPGAVRKGAFLSCCSNMDRVRLDLLRFISVLALAAGIALVAVFTPALDRMLSHKVQGAPEDFKYGTLGIRRAQGVRYHFDSGTIEKLSRVATGKQVSIAARVNSTPDIISAGRVAAKVHIEFYIGDYFQALHLPVLWLHTQNASMDNSRSRGIVITESLAQHLFGSAHGVLGRPLAVRNPGTPYVIKTFIVGILPDSSGFHGLFGGPPTSAWLNFPAYASLRGFKFTPPKTVDGVTYKSTFQFDGIPVLVSVPDTMNAARLQVVLDNLWQEAVVQGLFVNARGFVIYPGYTSSPVATTTARQRTRLVQVIAYVICIVALLNFLFAILIHNLKERQRSEMLDVLGRTSRMLVADRLIAAAKTGAALLAISACMVPLAFALQRRVGIFTAVLASGHAAWTISFGYVLASLGIVFLLQFLVDVASIRALSSGKFGTLAGARLAYQIVGTVEYILAGMLVIVAASAITAMVSASRADMGIFKGGASIITVTRKTKSLPSLAVPDSPTGFEQAISANNLALDAAYAAILKTDPSAAVGFGPIPDVSQYGGMSQSALVANGRRADICVFAAGPGWQEAAGARLLAGQSISKAAGASIVISSRSAATLFGSAVRAIGGSVHLINGTIYKLYTVVGVIRPFVVDASMVPCPAALTPIYGRMNDFNQNGGHFVVRPVVPHAISTVLMERIDAALARAGTQLQVKSVQTSDDLRQQLLAPYILQSAIYLLVALTGALIAISGTFAQLLYAVAMRRRNAAICSALGRKPSHIHLGLLGEFLAPPVIGLVTANVLAAWLVARFKYDINGGYISVLSLSSFTALAILFLVTVMVLHFPARRAARAEPAESLHEL